MPTTPPVEPVNGGQLLDDVERYVRNYCVLPNEESYVAVTLWIAHTYAFRCWDTTPRLAILSAEMGSGKTRVLEVLNQLCFDSALLTNTTISYVFRRLESGQPTLLVDETDAVFATTRGGKLDPSKEELRGIINSGYRKSGMVGRVEQVDGKMVPTDFHVFGAMALAGIRMLPDTLMDRSIVIWIRRRTSDEKVSSYRERTARDAALPITTKLCRWSREAHETLMSLLDDEHLFLPDVIDDRNADKWVPLLALAYTVGGDWHKRAQEAALTFVQAHPEANTDTTGVTLLRDIKAVFETYPHDAIPSETLVEWLQASAETMWDSRLTQHKLGRYLHPYEIATRQIRFADGSNRRGYERQMFEDAWKRYLGGDESVT